MCVWRLTDGWTNVCWSTKQNCIKIHMYYFWSDLYSPIVPTSMTSAAKIPQITVTAESTKSLVVRLLEVQTQQRRVRKVRVMTTTTTELRHFQLCYKGLETTLTVLRCVNGMSNKRE